MKKIFLILTFLVTLSFCTSVSVAEERETPKIDVALNRLLQSHLKFISEWQNSSSELDEFDKIFFTDFNFLNAGNTKNFFQNIQHNLESGKVYPGLMQVSYSSFTSINGKVTGVNYEYKSDGKNIVLTKGTYNNGEMLRAVYNYNIDGKLLNTTEVKGNKLLNKKSYRLEI
ncbi:MAG TPA: hypothetical protein PK079_22260 [Leptospiraceae bacterium]|nr:hypothetical protein [Leptospiraceae bacterium]HMW08454.1 hypothetical protein [Leptospiraceae bacterium]HMX33888.1 hypothetical protein [Leptospiraceae bacterium]HMY34201.1 hypothetical protein [Leptospiraceae bacterium]HMZ66419.1 hypothetical protein [Leptospiraceae bacterium]